MANSFSRYGISSLICAGGVLPGVVVFGQAPPADNSLDQLFALLNTPITTATRTAQSSAKAPATVVTVTSEQIRSRATGPWVRSCAISPSSRWTTDSVRRTTTR